MELATKTMDVPIKHLKLKEIKNEIDFWISYYGSLKDCPFSIVERVIALYNAQKNYNEREEGIQKAEEDNHRDSVKKRISFIRMIAEDQEITGGKSRTIKLKRKK